MTDSNNTSDGSRTSTSSDTTTPTSENNSNMPEKLWLFEENIKQVP